MRTHSQYGKAGCPVALSQALTAPTVGADGLRLGPPAQFGLSHISAGDLLRAEVANETEAGLAAKQYMDNGDLVRSCAARRGPRRTKISRAS